MTKTDPHALSIGAVSRLTGIPTDTLRTWERRHSVVTPGRNEAGRRFYTTDDVERLVAIARLAEQGERVSDLARLTSGELQERAALHVGEQTLPEKIRVAVVHPAQLAIQEKVAGQKPRLEIVARVATLQELPNREYEVLLVALDALGPDPLAGLTRATEKLPGVRVAVTYHFAPAAVLRRLRATGAALLQGSKTAAALGEAILDVCRRTAPELPTSEASVPPPLFDRSQLEQLLNSSPELLCECPNHLASLAIAMRQFEIYSLRCESSSPADAQLHHDLSKATGQMRFELEKLIRRVCAHDGIEI